MNRRPTPETDVADGKPTWQADIVEVGWVQSDFARCLERERDEAREELAAERALADRLGQSLLRLSGMSPLIHAHAMDDLAAWKEARSE